jgi:hypothetical protein
MRDAVERAPGIRTPRVFVSASDGQGLDLLRGVIAEQVAGDALNAGAVPLYPRLPVSLNDAAGASGTDEPPYRVKQA